MNYLAAADLACVSFPGRRRPRKMLMLECYFDDSGTHQGSRVVSWGGIMGTTQEIQKLADAWTALLLEPLPGKPQLRQFHLSHCARSWGEFVDYKLAERDAVRFAFRSVIAESGVEIFSAAVSIADWDEIIVGPSRDYFGSAEQCAMSECIRFGLQHASDLQEAEVSLTFDQGRKRPPLVERVNRVKQCYNGFSRLENIGFSPVDQFVTLQAADTIATESYWHALDWLVESEAKPQPHFQSLLNKVAGNGLLIDREEALRNLDRFEAMTVTSRI